MNIQITARKFKAHDTLKEFIKDEVTSLERFNDEIIDADVILSYLNNQNSIKKSGNRFKYSWTNIECS